MNDGEIIPRGVYEGSFYFWDLMVVKCLYCMEEGILVVKLYVQENTCNADSRLRLFTQIHIFRNITR